MSVQTMAMAEPPKPLDPTTWTSTPSQDPTNTYENPSEPVGPDGEFSGDIKVSQKPPSAADLGAVDDLPVLDANHNSVPFKSIYNSPEKHRVLVIFIRHFFCGNCQEYLRTLCASVTPEALNALPTPTSLVIIGCGQPDLIPFYASATSCPFPIYADPTKALYAKLGMVRTLDLGKSAPEYMRKPLFSVMMQSVFQVLVSGRKAFKGGDYWQVGGEFLFEDGEVRWTHRMRNTRDHAEVREVRRVVGLDGEGTVRRSKRWSMLDGLEGTRIGRRVSGERARSWSRKRNSGRVEGEGGRESKEGSVMGRVIKEEEVRKEGLQEEPAGGTVVA